MTKLNIVVKTQAGKPVDRASVVVRFVEGHSVVKLGKAIRTTFELRTNQEGEAKIPLHPARQDPHPGDRQRLPDLRPDLRCQRRGETLDITLNPPQQQYSAH